MRAPRDRPLFDPADEEPRPPRYGDDYDGPSEPLDDERRAEEP